MNFINFSVFYRFLFPEVIIKREMCVIFETLVEPRSGLLISKHSYLRLFCCSWEFVGVAAAYPMHKVHAPSLFLRAR